VHYVGAGTVEFIVEQKPDGAMQFFFMEMNTRLQVEHPVTEAITGLDLVEWQLRVASGEALPLRQDQLRIHGHAIEARICAENPDSNFLPATGTLHVYGLPACTTFSRSDSGVRVDSGVRQGDTISPYYDSMVAKLIVHGATRAEALARMDTALAQTHIVGLATNVQFLRHVVRSESFATANLDTGLIPREHAAVFNQEKIGLPLAAAALVAHTLVTEQVQEKEQASRTNPLGWADPWAQRDGWMSHGDAVRAFAVEFQGETSTVQLTTVHGSGLPVHQLQVQGTTMPLRYASQPGGVLDVALGAERVRVNVYRNGDVAHVFTAQGATQIIAIDAMAHAGVAQAEVGRLTAPMPGKVVSFAVKAGDAVQKGQPLAVMDAMKMEHTIAAPADGVVAELLFAPGDQVTEGAELLRLETLA
jgi:3-methylcrotonyl-CoA carboxylase alpha subunit